MLRLCGYPKSSSTIARSFIDRWQRVISVSMCHSAEVEEDLFLETENEAKNTEIAESQAIELFQVGDISNAWQITSMLVKQGNIPSLALFREITRSFAIYKYESAIQNNIDKIKSYDLKVEPEHYGHLFISKICRKKPALFVIENCLKEDPSFKLAMEQCTMATTEIRKSGCPEEVGKWEELVASWHPSFKKVYDTSFKESETQEILERIKELVQKEKMKEAEALVASVPQTAMHFSKCVSIVMYRLVEENNATRIQHWLNCLGTKSVFLPQRLINMLTAKGFAVHNDKYAPIFGTRENATQKLLGYYKPSIFSQHSTSDGYNVIQEKE